MVVYQYEFIEIPHPINNETRMEFRRLGSEGYKLVTIQNGVAYFEREVTLMDRTTCQGNGTTTPGQGQNAQMRPVDEKEYILQLLHKHNFSRAAVAKEMDISTRTLFRKMDTYGMEKKFSPLKGKKKVDHK